MKSEYAELVREILKDAYLVTLGIADAEGPWVANVIFVHDEAGVLYWMSEKTTRHSRAIEEGGEIAASIVAEWKDGRERALQMTGTARAIAGRLPEMEARLYAKIGKDIPPKLEEKLASAYSWYTCTPTRIELIHNERYGWDRQRVL